ncbi:zf-HC2 domain-containing protein [Thermopirellula anaerolimosa]
MLRCREVSKLVSESLDHELPLRIRLQVWLHLAMCRLCSAFARQVRLFRRAARNHPDRLMPDDRDPRATLSPEARARIKSALQGREN